MEAEKTQEVRILCLSGGAFRGAVQVPVIRHLCKENKYDGIWGISVGSINGSMASMGKLTELLFIWKSIDGIGGFLSFRYVYNLLWILGIIELLQWLGVRLVGGFYSMKPLRRKLDQYVFLKDVKTPFTAGWVSGNTGKYHEACTKLIGEDEDLRNAIEASSCMVPIMQPPILKVGDDEELGFDGGYRNIIPVPAAYLEKAKKDKAKIIIDVITCTPLDRIEWTSTQKVDGTIQMGVRGIEIMEAEIFESDIVRLRYAAGPDGVLFVYSPSFDTGSPLDASADTIKLRLDEGERMIGSPIVLKGL